MGTNPSTSASPVSPSRAMRASRAAASTTARSDDGGAEVQSMGSSASIASLRASSGVVNRSDKGTYFGAGPAGAVGTDSAPTVGDSVSTGNGSTSAGAVSEVADISV